MITVWLVGTVISFIVLGFCLTVWYRPEDMGLDEEIEIDGN